MMLSPQLKAREDESVLTAYDAFFHGQEIANRVGDSRFLGYRTELDKNTPGPYEFITYDEVLEQSTNVASGLVHIGFKPGPDNFIGIYSINCPQWMITAIACTFQSFVIVPLYHTASDSNLIHIVGQCDVKVCFVQSQKDVDRLLQLKAGCPCLEWLVSFDNLGKDQVERAKRYNVELLSFAELQSLGAQNRKPFNPPGVDDIVNICYTSGTTGPPKGAMLTHRNLIAVIGAQSHDLMKIHEEGREILISYLPLAHALGFGVEFCCMYHGYKIGYFNGDVKKLFDDMKELKPTLMPTVPRLLDRVYTEIQKKLDRKKIGMFKSVLFKLTYSLKRRSLYNGDYRKRHLADRVVFGPIQAMFGGHLKLILVGSSPSSPDVLAFMKVVLGSIIIEGYGQTECCGASHAQPLYDMSVGNVGRCLQCCEMKIVDVPELKYFARNNMGELCVRGHNVFPGYYKNPEQTKEVLDEDGWLHTGDIAIITKEGKVSIIDRKKEMFKLSQGEYVVPSKIEQVYQRVDLVSQCFVYGNPYKSFTIAIIVPDQDVLQELAKKHNITGTFEELCKDPKIIQLVQKALDSASHAAQLNGVERIRKIHLCPEQFSIENGLLTPTLKLRRAVCASHFRPEIDALYSISE